MPVFNTKSDYRVSH